MKHTNRLINATSPYLLQHAHNPVDWYEWGSEALEKALAEDKPILVSIGYSACHWCHVMAHQSFENESLASLMNDNYICIKVDREERPDIDQVYMEAVQALGTQGGWPLNVFLTPDQIPFFGGTYFTPKAWEQVLINIRRAYDTRRDDIVKMGAELRAHLQTERFGSGEEARSFLEVTSEAAERIAADFDDEWGGFKRAPKFVMPSVWHFLLRQYYLSGNPSYPDQVFRTLNRITLGGLYDWVGGGFARYSVDSKWFAPHFEKMLYDNAQLLSLFSEGWMLTGWNAYKDVVYETVAWLEREMMNPGGGFYSALDADSEGEEGKFYVWSEKEIREVAGDEVDLILDYFNIKPGGNWEHGKNILFRRWDDEAFCKKHNVDPAQFSNLLDKIKQALFRDREKRIRPGLDDKVLLGWNAMTCCGLVDAYRAFADDKFLQLALTTMKFLESTFMDGTKWYRSWKGNQPVTGAFLADYAALIRVWIRFYEVTFDEQWIQKASTLLNLVLELFSDEDEVFFYYTSRQDTPLFVRKKELYDNVIPSSNAYMAENLYRLGLLNDHTEWTSRAQKMVQKALPSMREAPHYTSQWAIVAQEIGFGLEEVAIIGKGAASLRTELHRKFHPFTLTLGAEGSATLPLLAGKEALNGADTIYVCREKTCLQPVFSVDDAIGQFRRKSEF